MRSSLLALLTAIGIFSSTAAQANVTLQVWHWWTDKQPMFEKLAAEYERATGVKVVFDASSPNQGVYYTKLQAAAIANVLPDMVGIAGGGEFLARYILAGKIVDLTSEMESGWKDRFFRPVLRDLYYPEGNGYGVPGGTYWAAPMSAQNMQIFYNRDVFAAAGLDPDNPPAMWPEFMAACEKLRAKRIAPFIAGFGDLWMNEAFLIVYAWHYNGEEGIRETVLGKRSYASDGWRSAYQRVADLSPYTTPGVVGIPNKDAERAFCDGQAAMAFNGSWAVNVYRQMNPNMKLGVMPFPRDPKAGYPLLFRGGVGAALAVSANSPNRAESIRFLKWLTDRAQMLTLARDAADIPSNHEVIDDLDDPSLKQFAAGMNDLMPDLKMSDPGEVHDEISRSVQAVLSSRERNLDALLARIQALKEKLVAQQSRVREMKTDQGPSERRFMLVFWLIALAAIALAAWRMGWNPARLKELGAEIGRQQSLYLFIAPALIIYVVFGLYPFVKTFLLSFYDWDGLSAHPTFVGWENYANALTDDPAFWTSMWHAAIIALAALLLQNAFALLLAIIVDTDIRGKNIYKLVFYVPPVLSVIVVGLVWRWIFKGDDAGLLNQILAGLGLHHLASAWLGEPTLALSSVIFVQCWQGFGNAFILFLAGLQTIPEELYEAAVIDGARGWNRFRFITFPMLFPVLCIISILTILGTMQTFALVIAMTGGGPSGATEVPVTYIYKSAFENFKFGYSTAMAVVLGLILMGLAFLQIHLSKRAYTRQ